MDKENLSIDLDFWLGHYNSRASGQFFSRVFNLNVPILFVIEHEELLEDINDSNARTLYNIDYHSDLCADYEIGDSDEAEDGIWANFVSWRRRGKYHWICPEITECYYKGEGTCCGSSNFDPFKNKKETAWKSVAVTENLKIIEWNKIERIGICLSPCYLTHESVKGVTKKLGMSHNDVRHLICNQSSITQRRTRGILAKIA